MNIWDWKYRIFFDDGIKEKLNDWLNSLAPNEVDIYNEIQSFYCSFFSFGILWDLIIEDNSKADQYIDKALKSKALIIKTRFLNKELYKVISCGFVNCWVNIFYTSFKSRRSFQFSRSNSRPSTDISVSR